MTPTTHAPATHDRHRPERHRRASLGLRAIIVAIATVLALAAGLLAVSATAGIVGLLPLAPAAATPASTTNPAQNIAPAPNFTVCLIVETAGCASEEVAALNHARAVIGLPAYSLPADFLNLPVDAQLLVLSNSDREAYRLTPITGLGSGLAAAAQLGAQDRRDPSPPDTLSGYHFSGWTSNWSDYPDPLAAYYEWMYFDGPGSNNSNCSAGSPAGCWGHRQDTLANFGAGAEVAMAVGANTGIGGPQYTELYWAYRPGTSGHISYTPTVTGISPTSGPAGSLVHLDGFGFVATSAVRVGSQSARFDVTSSSSITAAVPSGSGSQHLAVTTSGGTSKTSAADEFGYSAPASRFMPVTPFRILDTRSGVGVRAGVVGARASVTLTVPLLPAGTTAVVLNLTATQLSGAAVSYVSACPAAEAVASCSATSAINAQRGVDIANEITVPVAADGKIRFYNNAGSIHLIADLAGYYTGGYSGTGPTRVLDTRRGVGVRAGAVGARASVTLTVPPLPAGTTAVVLNLTATQLTGAAVSYISACPAAEAVASCSATSAINTQRGVDIANEITVPVAANRQLRFYNNAGSINLIADLAGYITGEYTSSGPTRVLDTRTGIGAPARAVGAGGVVGLVVPNLPAGTTAVVLNLTATHLTGAGASYLSACPANQAVPSCAASSAINARPGVDIANEITVPVAPNGGITFYNNAGSVEVVADLAGYYTDR